MKDGLNNKTRQFKMKLVGPQGLVRCAQVFDPNADAFAHLRPLCELRRTRGSHLVSDT